MSLRLYLETGWRYTNLILFPILAGLLVLIRPTILLLIGERFLPAAPIIYLLLPAVCFLCLGLIHKEILLVYERQKTIFLAQSLGFLTFLVMSVYLIEKIGIIGAAISISLGSLISLLLLYLFSIRLERIQGYFTHLARPLFASIVMGSIISLIQPTNIPLLLSTGLLGGASYIALMWLIRGIDRDDLERLRGALR